MPSRRRWIGFLVLCLTVMVFGAAHAAAFDPAAATDAYIKTVPEADRLRSNAYFEGGYWLILWNALYGIAVAVLLLGTGVSARMRDLAGRLGRGRAWPTSAIYGVLFMLATALLTLPLDLYQGYFREHQYGLSNQTIGSWAGDSLIGLAQTLVAAAIVLPVVYSAIRRARERWWLWGAAIVALFMIVANIISPVFLEPMLNHFEPLADGPLKQSILALANSNGVAATDVLEDDESRQSKRISAHVSGLFGTTRITLNDNLVNQCTPDEVRAVMGHEMGHDVMNHPLTITLFEALIFAGGFAFAQWSFGRLNRRFGARWGVSGVDDVAGLPILVAAFTAYSLVMTPVSNSIIRMHEQAADIFGLDLARRPDAFATVALKLAAYRKLSPSPLEEIIFYDHPSGRTRIFTAMRWKADQPDAAPPSP